GGGLPLRAVGADGARRYRLLPGTHSPRAQQSKGKVARLRARQSDLSPQFDLYDPAGYYDKAHGTLNFAAIEKAKKEAPLGNLSTDNELHYNDGYPTVRAWNLSVDEIRRDGALFNMYRGALFSGLERAERVRLFLVGIFQLEEHDRKSVQINDDVPPPTA